jgi:hypothetical protein
MENSIDREVQRIIKMTLQNAIGKFKNARWKFENLENAIE